MAQDKLFLIMPAYNEAENIENVLSQWYPVIEQIGQESRLILIDDGSTDDTFAIACKFLTQHPQVHMIHTENHGHGNALLTGYQYAIAKKADYIFQTDSDGQTSPKYFDLLWENRKNKTFQIGYRKQREDGFSRVIVTKVLRLVLFGIFGCWMQDANCPYRLMERKSLKQILPLLPEKPELANVLITAAYTYKKQDIQYHIIPFKSRQAGKNSIKWHNAARIGLRNLKTFWAFRKKLANQD